jgi:hypothetical protein
MHETIPRRSGDPGQLGLLDPPALSGDLDDIVAYMHHIGHRSAGSGGADRSAAAFLRARRVEPGEGLPQQP